MRSSWSLYYDRNRDLKNCELNFGSKSDFRKKKMGCALSCEDEMAMQEAFRNLAEEDSFVEVWEQIKALQLSEEDAKSIFRSFYQLDAEKKGGVDIIEALMSLGIERLAFVVRALAVQDTDLDGVVDFGEFFVAVWNYCTLGEVNMARFAFELYDQHQHGALQEEQVQALISDLQSDRVYSSRSFEISQALLTLVRNQHSLDLLTFIDFCREHTGFLAPVTNIQTALRAKIVGTPFWEVHTDRRRDPSHDTLINSLLLHAQRKVSTDTQVAMLEAPTSEPTSPTLASGRRRRSLGPYLPRDKQSKAERMRFMEKKIFLLEETIRALNKQLDSSRSQDGGTSPCHSCHVA